MLQIVASIAQSFANKYGIAASLALGYALYLLLKTFYRCMRTRGLQYADVCVFITGGSTGIGLSVAKEYAKMGANICILGGVVAQESDDFSLRFCL